MPAPSTILERPEFAILRRLNPQQLGCINPRWARRQRPRTCPLGMALAWEVYDPEDVIDALHAYDIPTGDEDEVWQETEAFLEGWDGNDDPDEGWKPWITRDDLAAAIAAALAEKEAADARP